LRTPPERVGTPLSSARKPFNADENNTYRVCIFFCSEGNKPEVAGEHMPMRSELAMTPMRNNAADNSAWAVIAFCLVGLVLTLCLGLYGMSFDDLSQLMLQYNPG
jgi:hypothetical protein